jgi:tRNA (guanine37-N1)-methyltransferase
MKIYVMTLFPEMVEQGLKSSITGRAIEEGILELKCVNIRDYTLDKHKKVDDYPYGGGAGMVMQAQPVFDCYQAIREEVGHDCPVIYMTPQGKTLKQSMAGSFAKEDTIILLCGHYEGIDERVLEEIVTDYISIGDYVLTGGELPAMVFVDCISRLVPGVLHNDQSAVGETFADDLLEYPQYSRPEVWQDKAVPKVLLSGYHRKIAEYRLEQQIERTKERRPDLWEKARPQLREKLSNRLRRNLLGES